jgi:hypothetical protein
MIDVRKPRALLDAGHTVSNSMFVAHTFDRTLDPLVPNDWLYQVADRNHSSGSELRIPKSPYTLLLSHYSFRNFRGRYTVALPTSLVRAFQIAQCFGAGVWSRW